MHSNSSSEQVGGGWGGLMWGHRAEGLLSRLLSRLVAQLARLSRLELPGTGRCTQTAQVDRLEAVGPKGRVAVWQG